MSSEPESGPELEGAYEAVADSVRTHLAIVDAWVVSFYLGAALARFALDQGLSPAAAARHLLASGTLLDDGEQWELERRDLKSFGRLQRGRFAGAAISFFKTDASQN